MQVLCTLDEVPRSGGLEHRVTLPDGPCSVMLFRVGGGVRAYRNVCPHMGRNLDLAPGEFLFTPDGRLVCPHHGACFDIGSGLCLEGPCRGESLAVVAVELRDGMVWLAGDAGEAGSGKREAGGEA